MTTPTCSRPHRSAADVNISGTYTVGDPGQVTYSVTNRSVDATVPTTISLDPLPAGLTRLGDQRQRLGLLRHHHGRWQMSAVHSGNIAGGATTASVNLISGGRSGGSTRSDRARVPDQQEAFAPNNSDSADVQGQASRPGDPRRAAVQRRYRRPLTASTSSTPVTHRRLVTSRSSTTCRPVSS